MHRRYRRIFDLRLGGRRRIDADMDAELESHIAMRVADLVRAGMSPEDARREALRRFGDFEVAQRQLRAGARQREATMSHRDWLGSVRADVIYALRQFRRAPMFTALAVATLSLGVAGTTSIFTLVDRILIEPMPYPASRQLVRFEGMDSTKSTTETISQRDWLDWRRASALESSAIYAIPQRQVVVTRDSSIRLTSDRVTPGFFTVLRARFVAGRSFAEAEVEDQAPVVVISERLWRQLFEADRRLTQQLRTPNRNYTIAGVVASGQEFPAGVDIWFPVPSTRRIDVPRYNINWYGVGRLRDGMTPERAAVEMSTIARGIVGTDPTALYDHGVAVTPLATAIVGDVGHYLMLLMSAVLFVLLIVCANVAASALARAASRQHEMAIRTSLGAPRRRLIRQLLIEHVMLGLAGGVVGAFAAWAVVRVIVARWGNQIPRAEEITFDLRIVAVALVAALVAGISAGLIPALRATGVAPRASLAAGGRTSASGGRNLAGASFVTAEIALAVLLLTGAGLLIRSFRAVLSRDIGFDTSVVTAEAVLGGPMFNTDTTRRYLFWDRLVDAYRQIPGVQAVGLAQWIPLGLTGSGFIDLADRDVPGAAAVYRVVNEDFFNALRIPRLAGRTFTRDDALGTQRVTVINQAMAKKYWPNQNPIGLQVRARSMEGFNGVPAQWLTIVGVVGDVRTYGLETDPRAEMYVSYRQVPMMTYGLTALVRASVPPAQLGRDLRRVAREVDTQVPVDVGSLDALLSRTLATRSLTMALLSAFAGVAMLLAALGIYGLLSYAVTRRTRELAVRAALGAQRPQLLNLVFRAGLRVVLPGMAIGFAGAILVTKVLESMLVDVSRIDATTYLLVGAGIFAVSVVAILAPARRATRLDPLIALQAE